MKKSQSLVNETIHVLEKLAGNAETLQRKTARIAPFKELAELQREQEKLLEELGKLDTKLKEEKDQVPETERQKIQTLLAAFNEANEVYIRNLSRHYGIIQFNSGNKGQA